MPAGGSAVIVSSGSGAGKGCLELCRSADPRRTQAPADDLIDEFTRECLAIRVARRTNSFGVLFIETMADVMLERGVPD